jgi:hypothetical protein
VLAALCFVVVGWLHFQVPMWLLAEGFRESGNSPSGGFGAGIAILFLIGFGVVMGGLTASAFSRFTSSKNVWGGLPVGRALLLALGVTLATDVALPLVLLVPQFLLILPFIPLVADFFVGRYCAGKAPFG